MKKILMIVVILITSFLSGCSALDEDYELLKATYQLGSAVVDLSGYESNTTKTIREVAETYDSAREIIRGDDYDND